MRLTITEAETILNEILEAVETTDFMPDVWMYLPSAVMDAAKGERCVITGIRLND